MFYKKLLKERRLRFCVLNCLRWVPDILMIQIQYKIKTGRWAHLKHPQRFTEKLQLYKMKYRNPVIHNCIDKYEVRKYIENKGLRCTLNEIYGLYTTAEEIKLESLPNQFVVKSTLGSGGQNVIVVYEKATCNWNIIKRTVSSWLKIRNIGANYGREWGYSGLSPRIIVERYLGDKNGLIDYKFFCFNGEPKFLYVLSDRKMGKSVKLGIYDVGFNKLNTYRCDEVKDEREVEKPLNYERMLDVARILSSDFPHVRIDLYNIEGNIYFGEMTFYDGSGYFGYDPDEFDFEVGKYFTEY